MAPIGDAPTVAIFYGSQTGLGFKDPDSGRDIVCKSFEILILPKKMLGNRFWLFVSHFERHSLLLRDLLPTL